MNIETLIAYIVGIVSCAAIALVAYMLGMAHGYNVAKREERDE